MLIIPSVAKDVPMQYPPPSPASGGHRTVLCPPPKKNLPL